MVDWRHLANVATVISLAVSLVILYIAWTEFLGAKEQLKILINQSNTQNELLQTENQAVIELAHQTIMQAYNLEKSHRVDISSCYYYPAEEKIEFQLDVMYNTEPNNPNSNWLPSTITFEVKTNVDSRLDEKETQKQLFVWHNPTLQPQFIGPSNENEWRFFLSDIFEDSKDSKNVVLYIRTQYFFTPYSIAKDIPLSDPIEQTGHLLLGLEKNENGEWSKITENENIVCN